MAWLLYWLIEFVFFKLTSLPLEKGLLLHKLEETLTLLTEVTALGISNSLLPWACLEYGLIKFNWSGDGITWAWAIIYDLLFNVDCSKISLSKS